MNICDLLERQAGQLGESPCVHHAGGTWSYRDLYLHVRRAAIALRQEGVRAGDVVAHAFADELTQLVTLLATARIGATAFSLPLNTPPVRRDELLHQVSAVWLATDLGELRLPGLTSITIDLATDEIFDAGQDDVGETSPQAPWLIATGSGSTGRPKLLPVSHRQQLARMTAGRDWLPYARQDVFASLIHLDYYASKQRFLEAFAKGASIALMDRRQLNLGNPQRPGRVTVLYGTVFHLEQLLASLPATVRGHLESLTALMVGGSTVSSALRATIGERLCRRLYVLYGANESHTTCITRVSEVFEMPGGVGRPHDGIELQIVDDNDRPLPAGETGRVRVRGECCIDGYLGDDAATRLAFRDGWFHPGDLGRMTADGQLIHMGRVDDLMIMNGINIYPAEIERTLLLHPAVDDAVAFPFSHPVHQDIPVCAVVMTPETAIAEQPLLAWVRERLGAHSPQRIFVLDHIPRNEQGKPVRSDILDRVAAMQQSGAELLPAMTAGSVSQATTGKQLGFRIRFAWYMPGQADPDRLEIWLRQVMDNESGGQGGDFHGGENMPPDSRAWLWRCLLLARLLLQGAGAPVFDAPRIIASEPALEGGGKWNSIVQFPLLDEYPNELYSSALGVAFGLAAWSIGRDPDGENLALFFNAIVQDFLKPARHKLPPGKSTFEVLKAAHARGIPFRHLGWGVFQLGWGSRARLLDRSTTRYDSAIGGKLSQNKALTARLLRAAGLPSAVHEVVLNPEAALVSARRLGWPLVVKPADGERGEGVTVGIEDEAGLKRAFEDARQHSRSGQILVEQLVEGTCHRLFIANGALLYAVKRLPMGVTGDGKQTVAELVASEVAAQRRRPPWKRSEIQPIDALARKALAAAGFSESSIPPDGVAVPLRPIESTEWGGIDEEVTERIHPENLRVALDAASLFGLNVAGIDIISTDIAIPWFQNGAIVNEVNFAPLLGGGAISRRQIARFLDDYICGDGGGGDGRIPVAVFVGGAAAWDLATRCWQQQVEEGRRACLTNGSEIRAASGEPLPMPLRGLYPCVRALVLSPRVDALVLVVQNDEFLASGLPLECVDSVTVVDGDLTSVGGGPLAAERFSHLERLLEQWCAP